MNLGRVLILGLRRMSTVSLIQMNASNNKEKNFDTCSRLISQVVASNTPAKTQLICLPECFSFIGENSSESIEAAEIIHESFIH
jgi:hypothetical protein